MRHSDLDLLHELRTWKLETAAMNTTGVGEANDSSHLGDSHWGNAGTITHKPNSDGTEANILRLDTGEDSGEVGRQNASVGTLSTCGCPPICNCPPICSCFDGVWMPNRMLVSTTNLTAPEREP